MYSLKEKFQKLALNFLPILLVACDDGTSNGSTISGTAADGYLRGAIVCLYSNENGLCDIPEPKTTTTEGGVYNIEIPDGTDTNKPLVVDVPATAIDEDTNQAVGKAYVMKAPAGKHSFVSPTTTLVQQEIENNPSMSVDDAEAAVKSSIRMNGDDVSLLTDYVAIQTNVSKTTEEKTQYTQIHKIARVVVQAISDNQETVNQAATEAGMDTQVLVQELFALVMETVKSKLSNIALEVAADEITTARDFDVKRAKENISITTQVDSIATKVHEQKQRLSTTTTSLTDLIEQPPLSIGSYRNRFSAEEMIFSPTTLAFKSYKFVAPNPWQSNADSWQWRSLSEDFKGLSFNKETQLAFNTKTQKWVSTTYEDKGGYSFLTTENGRFVLADNTTGTEYILSVSQTDITGQKIPNNFQNLPPLSRKVNGNATFPQGSIGLTMDVIRTNPEIGIDIHNRLPTPIVIVTHDNDTPNAAKDGSWKTLDEIFISADDLAGVNYGENLDTFLLYVPDNKLGSIFYYDLLANNGDSGTIRYYDYHYDNPSLNKLKLFPKQGTWEKKSLGDKTIVLISHPTALGEITDHGRAYEKNSKLFYTVHNGFVRRGYYHPANHHFVLDGYTNKIATQAALNAFGIATYPE